MLAILKNLVSVARRFQLAAALNILGLSVAFAAFMVIMIQLDYDYGFDKCHKDYDKIFRMEIDIPNFSNGYAGVFSRPLAERFFESSPHIVAGGIANIWEGEIFFHVENDGERNFFKESSISVSPEFTEVFTFNLVEGAEDALKTPNNVLIPQSLARKLFGNESAIGQQLVFNWGNQTVGAVYRDFPANNILNNCIYVALRENENKNNWGDWSYTSFIRLNDASNAPLLFENFKRTLDVSQAPSYMASSFDWEESGINIRLTPLPDIHFITDVQYDYTPKASRQTLMILFAIAIVIIAIACINFTNFSTALTPMRVKSLNTQHVLGLRRSKLRFALVFEAIVVCFLSYLVALLLVDLFKNTPLSQLIDGNLAYSANPVIFAGTAFVAILAGFIAGVYPARYMTSFEPAFVLKGSFAL